MLSISQKPIEVQAKTTTVQKDQPSSQLKATWVVENNQLVCKWLSA